MKIKKIAMIVTTLALTAALAIGGTLAFLTAQTDTVANTFTVGKVGVTLTEAYNTDKSGDGINDAWTAQLIPGTSYTKNPSVAVSQDSEGCYLFVKFEETNSPATYLNYTSNLTTDNGWSKLTGVDNVDNVWYRVVNKADATKSWELLSGNTVSVKDTVGSVSVPMPAQDVTPSLAYTAYAVQRANIDSAVAAWAKLS